MRERNWGLGLGFGDWDEERWENGAMKKMVRNVRMKRRRRNEGIGGSERGCWGLYRLHAFAMERSGEEEDEGVREVGV